MTLTPRDPDSRPSILYRQFSKIMSGMTLPYTPLYQWFLLLPLPDMTVLRCPYCGPQKSHSARFGVDTAVSDYRVVQKSQFQIINKKSRIKSLSAKAANEIRYFFLSWNKKCQTSTVTFSLGMKYSMRDLICDVNYSARGANLRCGSHKCQLCQLSLWHRFALASLKFTPRPPTKWKFT